MFNICNLKRVININEAKYVINKNELQYRSFYIYDSVKHYIQNYKEELKLYISQNH